AAGPIERRRARLPATRAGTERDRLVIEDGPIAREAGDGRLAAAGRPGENPGTAPVYHRRRVQQHAALPHEEEAAQQPEQIGIERRPGASRKGGAPSSQIALGARGMAREREPAPGPGGCGWRHRARTIALGHAHVNAEGRRTPRQERSVAAFYPGAARRG